jgi:hypothetical protein
MKKNRMLVVGALAWLVVAGGLFAANPSLIGTTTEPIDVMHRPELVLGSDSCVKCHAGEVEVWKKTPHFRTFEELYRRPEAKQIAAKLNVQSIKYDGRCINCHFTQQHQGSEVAAISGVSCESCHGPAKNWIDVHNDYGSKDITRLTESPVHRQSRIATAMSLGMRNPHNVYRIAQSCYRCHTVADEQLVNVGGHSPGSLDFEIVSWSQGMVRHNFARTDNRANAPSTPERQRLMFAAGMLADLEFSLRAVAVATAKEKFGVTVAQRASRAAKRLQSAAQKTNHPLLVQAVDIFGTVTLKLNNAAELNQAADRIAELGIRLGNESNGSDLESLAPFIPTPDRWK